MTSIRRVSLISAMRSEGSSIKPFILSTCQSSSLPSQSKGNGGRCELGAALNHELKEDTKHKSMQ